MQVEIRENSVTIEGYVTAVGRDSRVMASPRGCFVEQVEPRTFDRELSRGRPVELRFNHERVLGSTADGTLELREDAIGLRAKAVSSDPELMERAGNGALSGWSFGFKCRKDHWEDWKDGVQRRYLEDLELREVSLLSGKVPAYIGTTVEVRDDENAIIEERSVPDEAEIQDKRPREERPNGLELAKYKARRTRLGK